jgi:predicted Zn-dependent peptidase
MSVARLTTLDNGVRVLVDPMPGLATASIGVWIEAGARPETAAENGIAHLLEHLVFKGAGGRGARALAEQAEALGIYLNAATGYERTGFAARCLAADTRFAFDLCADLVLAPHLDPADLELEKGVVIQEIGEAFDDAEDRAGVLHQLASWPDQPLGRSILGEPDGLKALSVEAIKAFRARTYTAGSILVAAAGAVDEAAVIEAVRARFAGLPAARGAAPEAASSAEAGVLTETRRSEQVHLMLSLPAPPAGDPLALPARILGEILGGGMASRLFQDLREERGLVYSVEAFADLYRDTGRLTVAAGCAAGAARDVAERTAGHIQALAKDGPTDAELARACRVLEASVMMSAEGPGARTEAAVGQTALHGRPISLDETSARIRAVTRDQITAAARHAVDGRPAAAALGPRNGLAAARHFAQSFG